MEQNKISSIPVHIDIVASQLGYNVAYYITLKKNSLYFLIPQSTEKPYWGSLSAWMTIWTLRFRTS